MKDYLIILIMVFFLSSCEEKLPPEDFTTEMSAIPVGKITYHSSDFYWSEYDGEDFERYEIYYKSTYDKDYQLYQAIKLVKLTFTTIYNLRPKTIYYFYVKVIKKDGNSYESQPYQIETLSDEPSPVTLYEISPKEITYNTARLRWSGYQDSLIVDFSSYKVYYSTSSQYFIPSAENFFDSLKIPVDTTRIINVLKEYTDYYFKIRTYNVLAKFSESYAQHIRTPYKPPDTVFLYNADEVTESYAKIRWTQSHTDHFSQYDIFVSELPYGLTNYRPYKTFYSREDTTLIINNLKKWGEYFVAVRVLRQITPTASTYSLSNMIDFTATFGGNPVPVTLWVEGVGRDFVFIEWTSALSKYPGGPYSIYVDTYPNFEITNNNGWGISPNNITNFWVRGLTPNTTYYIKVLFVTRFSKSSLSNEVKVTTYP